MSQEPPAPEQAASVDGNPDSVPSVARKPIHSLCIDTGPLIKNDPPVSTLLAQAEELYMLPSILAEIRDVNTRTRVETTLMPFVKLRNPRPESVKFVTGFARRTGDLEVLSRPDLHLLALTYELEVERNGGDWRLRKDPGQRRINGKPPGSGGESAETQTAEEAQTTEEVETTSRENDTEQTTAAPDISTSEEAAAADVDVDVAKLGDSIGDLDVADNTDAPATISKPSENDVDESGDFSDSDDGWITPSNLKKHQAKDNTLTTPTTTPLGVQVGILTTDFAMQNVALRIGLNTLSSSMARITHLKTWILRCHGCFQICKKMDRQFCPSCGQATLIRTSCSTDDSGNFTIHLKKNFQWKNRGNVYSVPKPVHGNASGKIAKDAGGGKNGWGRSLIFAEDQKEYSRAVDANRRAKQRDLMDEDYLPSILSGDRGNGNGRIRVGAGRSINASRRRG